METITFEVHLITPTSPRNTLKIIFKSIAFYILCIFSFWTYHVWAYKRKKKYPIMYAKTLQFCHAEAHKCYTWLAGFSGETVIYAFLLEFSSHSRQEEWYEY